MEGTREKNRTEPQEVGQEGIGSLLLAAAYQTGLLATLSATIQGVDSSLLSSGLPRAPFGGGPTRADLAVSAAGSSANVFGDHITRWYNAQSVAKLGRLAQPLDSFNRIAQSLALCWSV